METIILFSAALALGAIVWFVFFRETRSVSVGPIGAKQPPLEPLAPRDWVEAELAEYNGQGGKSIYIAADGIVFNMSSHPTGPSFYGPGGPYGAFAGRDATIALATMQVDPAQCTKRSLGELSASERDTLADWVSRFSAKYEVAGYLNDGVSPRTMLGAMGGNARAQSQPAVEAAEAQPPAAAAGSATPEEKKSS